MTRDNPRKLFHLALNVRNALAEWVYPEGYADMFAEQDGTVLTPEQTRKLLLGLIADGQFFLPMLNPGQECEGWDYRTGCPGHDAGDAAEELSPDLPAT